MIALQTLEWQPTHGYALVQHNQQRSQDLLQVEEGSLYPALQRMRRYRRRVRGADQPVAGALLAR